MMKQYIVLQNIAPDQGPIIYPSATADDPPTLIDESVIRGETDEERAANAQKLIALGVIAVLPEPAPAPEAKPTPEPKPTPDFKPTRITRATSEV
jgi:hypothetical protein